MDLEEMFRGLVLVRLVQIQMKEWLSPEYLSK